MPEAFFERTWGALMVQKGAEFPFCRMKENTIFSLLIALFTLPAFSSQAAVWTGAVDNDWNTAGNWTGGVPSGAIADVNNGGTATISSAAPSITRLRIGVSTGQSGTVNIGAALTATDNSATDIGLGGTGFLNINSGANFQMTGGATARYRFGVNAGAVGTGNHTGGSVSTTATIFIGVSGTGHYSLSGGSLSTTQNFTLASAVDGSGNFTQSGGNVTIGSVGAGGSAFIGQNGAGTFNLSGGTFTASSVTVATGTMASGNLTQTGGTIDLLNGVDTGMSWTKTLSVNNNGTYSISHGSLLANSFIMGNSTVLGGAAAISGDADIQLSVDLGINGTLSVNGSGAAISVGNAFNLFSEGTINFHFDSTGISTINVVGNGGINPAGTINVDGSAYLGGPGSTFTLINAAAFDAAPAINLTGFSSPVSYDWDLATGNFTVSVIPEPSTMALFVIGGLAGQFFLRRRRRSKNDGRVLRTGGKRVPDKIGG